MTWGIHLDIRDFDGDKMSMTGLWTKDAIEEVNGLLNKWSFYISSNNTMSFSLSDDVIDIILSSMTKRIQ